MSKMTRREMLKLMLAEQYKAKEIVSRNKYHMMEGIGRDGSVVYFFLGENGALRTGHTKNASKSTSITHNIKLEVLENWLDERGLI